MIAAILWKEWKRFRWYFAAFLFIAIVCSLLLTGYPGTDGAIARKWLRVVWIGLSAVLGFLFSRERRRGSLSFLFALPAMRSTILTMHWLACAIIFAIFIAGTLSIHCVHLLLVVPEASVLDVLLEPELLFALASCFLVFALCTVAGSTMQSFGFLPFGILLFLVFLVFAVFMDRIESFLREFRSLAAVESPGVFLMICLSGGLLFATVSLLEVSFNELRDTHNRKWRIAAIVLCVLSLALLTCTSLSASWLIAKPGASARITRVLGIDNNCYPVVAFIEDDSGKGVLVTRFAAGGARGTFVKFHGPPDPRYRPFILKKLKEDEKHFFYAPGRGYYPPGFARTLLSPVFGWGSQWKIAYFSNKLFWGPETRALNLGHVPTIFRISPRRYSRREQLGRPFLSPHGDRIACLRTWKPRIGVRRTTELWITKLDYSHVSDYAVLSDGRKSTEDKPVWTPIGWTPDGDDFLLQKTHAEGKTIWAVDWLATGKRPFLEEFPDATITEADLPEDGLWFTLVREVPGGEHELWLVRRWSDEKELLGSFAQPPLRAWRMDGFWFAYWSHGSGLCVVSPRNKLHKKNICPSLGEISQMKWQRKRGSGVLAVVAREEGTGGLKSDLNLIEPSTLRSDFTSTVQPQLLVEDFHATEDQWDWLSDTAIAYADGGELWQIERIWGEKTLILSAASLNEKN